MPWWLSPDPFGACRRSCCHTSRHPIRSTASRPFEFASGISGTLAMVRSTPAYFRLHAFGRDVSAEALGRTDLVLRRSGAEPRHLSFPSVDSVRINLEAFADAVAGRATYPIPMSEMLDTVAAFEAIAEAA